VQVDPIKPTLKALGTKRLKLKSDAALSSFAFEFNLRHYNVGGGKCTAHGGGKRCVEEGCNAGDRGGGKCIAHGGGKRCQAGAYTRRLLSST
jgi:hypothetical protein